MKVVAISDAVTLAIHTMELLARNPRQRWTTPKIAAEFNASPHHLAKVNTRLVKAGLLLSTRGPGGGLTLARDPAKIHLIDIFRSVDGELTPSPCLFGQPVCRRRQCLFGSLIKDVTRQILDYLSQTTVADLVEDTG